MGDAKEANWINPMNESGLPIIDLRTFTGANGDRRHAVATEIQRACEETGFFYLSGHGVPGEVIGEALAASAAFFDLPTAEKRAIAVTPRNYRGYIPLAAFSANKGGRPPDLYEGYKINLEVRPDDPLVVAGNWLYGPNVWPVKPATFRPALTAYWDGLTSLASVLLRAFALALEVPEETFARNFAKPLSNISLLHYPPMQADSPERQGIHPHRDTCAFTILLPGRVGGLEVKRRDGGWIDAPPLPGCFVVNIGDMLERWTAGRFKSTPHRVVNRSGAERYSIAYFALPDHDTLIAPLPGIADQDAAADFAPIHTGEDFARIIATNWA